MNDTGYTNEINARDAERYFQSRPDDDSAEDKKYIREKIIGEAMTPIDLIEKAEAAHFSDTDIVEMISEAFDRDDLAEYYYVMYKEFIKIDTNNKLS